MSNFVKLKKDSALHHLSPLGNLFPKYMACAPNQIIPSNN